MGLLDGLDKFGLDVNQESLFHENEKAEEVKEAEDEQVITGPVEKDFLMDKKRTCPICDHTFVSKSVITSKLRRKDPDKDLRPRFVAIDTLKYDVVACPYCGYAAMNRYFDHISTLQMKLIREQICSKYQAGILEVPEVYSYDEALDRYKLSLYNSIVKKAKMSEKAYTCLKMAWLLRGKQETLVKEGMTEHAEEIMQCRQKENEYYAQAYEGLSNAMANESYPICGMDQNTYDLLLAQMAFVLGKIEESSRFVSRLLVSPTAGRNIKDRARDLKDEIISQIRGVKKN